MKKLVFFIILIITLASLSACDRDNESSINKADLAHQFTLENIPKSLQDKDSILTYLNDYIEINKYKTSDLLRIFTAFDETKVLLENFNEFIDQVIVHNRLVIGDRYQNEDYTYLIEKVGESYHLTVNQSEALVLQAKTNLNGHYEGEFHLQGDDLEFTIKAEKLTFTYFDADDDSHVTHELILGQDYLRLIIIYQDLSEDYVLTAVANDQLSGILMSNKLVDTKRMTISDVDGYALYESMALGGATFSGFHLHALGNYTRITQIDDDVYQVDDLVLEYNETMSNLFNISLDYLNEEEAIVSKEIILLGNRGQKGYPNILALRNPFTSEQYEAINVLSNELYNYMYNSEY